MKKTVEWHIFKKTPGMPWPGEYWERFTNERKAKKRFKEDYDGTTFLLVRVVFDSV